MAGTVKRPPAHLSTLQGGVELFCCVLQVVGLLLDLRLSVYFWFLMDDSYKSMQGFCFFWLFRASPLAVIFIALQESRYTLAMAVALRYSLGFFQGRVMRGSSSGSHHRRKRFCGIRYHRVFRWVPCFRRKVDYSEMEWLRW